MKNIYFFGRFPAYKQVGGVTTFTYNFSFKYKASNLLTVDLYPAEGKVVPNGVRWLQFKGGMINRLFKFYKFHFINEGIYFFNFSSVRSMLLLYFMPKKTKSKWFAIFHNGEQERNFRELNIVQKYIVKRGIGKLDALGCLSEKQSTFFETIYEGKFYKVSPYIPLGINSESQMHKRKHDSPTRILITGFPTAIYRILETLDVLDKLWSKGYCFELTVCLYGFDTDNLLLAIKNKVQRLNKAEIFMHLDDKQFSKILDSTDLYLRLNSVDSYGLVVAEAIDRNIDVLATNVCERYPGTVLVNVDDFDTVYNELIFYFENKQFSDELQIQAVASDQVDYALLIKELEEESY
ncbi:glycosyltransferase [Pseudoalteromonas sp. SG41-2]|uniref:glycosyltransferase n=1 Tax=Pseudoalteromonas sp. SG41-2 TaxID=2760978 RepID=UPI0016041E7F|nr:glycosyltransferase [Pseudoalteromonas sp. SG41-2]MBB1482041.1 glycosyltransferase [Pseudoalteromonas sp. SG41-2]